MKVELKLDACIICGRKVQPTENWMRCQLPSKDCATYTLTS